jgi:3-oxoadipate enol-lactonase
MPATSDSVAARYAADVRRTLPDVYLTTFAAILGEDLRADLAKVRTPALVLTGEHDVSAPPQLAAQLAQGIPGARFAVIPAANHFSNLDQPQRFNALVRDFLRESERAAA